MSDTPAPESTSEGSGQTDANAVEGQVQEGGTGNAGGGSTITTDWEAEAKKWQGKYDKLSAAQQQPKPVEPNPTTALAQPDAVALVDLLDKRMALREARSVAREQYPMARQSVLDSWTKFGSEQDYLDVVERDHIEVNSLIEREKTRIESELREQFEQQFGKMSAPPTNNSGVTGAEGEYTAADLAKMSLSEYNEFAEKHPDVVQRILSKDS